MVKDETGELSLGNRECKSGCAGLRLVRFRADFFLFIFFNGLLGEMWPSREAAGGGRARETHSKHA